jgi:hypothetical protein
MLVALSRGSLGRLLAVGGVAVLVIFGHEFGKVPGGRG